MYPEITVPQTCTHVLYLILLFAGFMIYKEFEEHFCPVWRLQNNCSFFKMNINMNVFSKQKFKNKKEINLTCFYFCSQIMVAIVLSNCNGSRDWLKNYFEANEIRTTGTFKTTCGSYDFVVHTKSL